MFMIEKVKFAPEWVQKAVKQRNPLAEYVVVFELHDVKEAGRFPILRDKTDMYVQAVRGMKEDLDINVQVIYGTGHDFAENYGWGPQGAQWIHKYCIMFA